MIGSDQKQTQIKININNFVDSKKHKSIEKYNKLTIDEQIKKFNYYFS